MEKKKIMPEAEVSLRLAFWLLDKCGVGAHADVALMART
jgi:hypothetical protein